MGRMNRGNRKGSEDADRSQASQVKSIRRETKQGVEFSKDCEAARLREYTREMSGRRGEPRCRKTRGEERCSEETGAEPRVQERASDNPKVLARVGTVARWNRREEQVQEQKTTFERVVQDEVGYPSKDREAPERGGRGVGVGIEATGISIEGSRTLVVVARHGEDSCRQETEWVEVVRDTTRVLGEFLSRSGWVEVIHKHSDERTVLQARCTSQADEARQEILKILLCTEPRGKEYPIGMPERGRAMNRRVIRCRRSAILGTPQLSLREINGNGVDPSRIGEIGTIGINPSRIGAIAIPSREETRGVSKAGENNSVRNVPRSAAVPCS
ncbi:hypothetical protein B0H16DRAFT_1475975 [Mycena metata]|uniref:Uncharacterized protein n=1 Tax=Mycena metata TaxID=1033252 RepID=A0AAD7MHI7_9AGAR|nr:hypothetical protein B0H16DRAFT_1475975 [Mycena metata]